MDAERTVKQELSSDPKREKVRVIPIQFFDDFPGHPFYVKMDDEMHALMESIKEFGILTPLIARKKENERYEIIAGHRRKFAAKKLGLPEIPVILREMTRDEAIIAMVDSNLHRERILPSERAYAYKMKMEARKRQGARVDLTSTPVVSKFRTDEMIGNEIGESREQIRRYIRLTFLTKNLLKMHILNLEAERELQSLRLKIFLQDLSNAISAVMRSELQMHRIEITITFATPIRKKDRVYAQATILCITSYTMRYFTISMKFFISSVSTEKSLLLACFIR